MVFLAALVVYFIGAHRTSEQEGAVYSSMDESRLPVVYTEFEGKEINGLHGYVQDMGIVRPEKRFLFCLQTEDWIFASMSLEIQLQKSVMR